MRHVYFWHLKSLGYCNREMRRWCKSKGLSWRDLIDNGIDADYLMEIDGSSLAVDAIAFAESTGWSKEPISAGTDDCHGRCV